MSTRSEFVYGERFFLTVGFAFISVLMTLAGMNYLDSAYGFLHINQDCYNLSRFYICLILGLCAGISMARGLLAGSILMLVTAVSCGSFIVSDFLGFNPSELQDTLLSFPIFMVAYFFYMRRDGYLAVATFLYGLALFLPLFFDGTAMDAVLGIGLLLGGILYSVYSSAIITEGETGIIRIKLGSVFRHKSVRGLGLNPYEIGVPICSIFAGVLLLFLCMFHVDSGMDFSSGDLITVAMFTLVICIIAFYLGLRNIIAEGLFYLLLSIELLVKLVPLVVSIDPIPSEMTLIIILPTLFISALCFRRRDWIFGTAILMNFLSVMISLFGHSMMSEQISSWIYGALELVMGALLLYHGVSRWLLVATRKEVLPLLSGNIVRITTDISTDNRVMRRRKEWSIAPVAIDMGHIMLSILLIWVAFNYLNGVYEFVHIEEHAYTISKLVIASFVATLAVISIGRGAVTESIVFLLIGLSCLDFGILEVLGMGGIVEADMTFALVLFIAGVFYLVRGRPVLGVSTVIYALSMTAPYSLGGDEGDVVLGLLMMVSGALYGGSALRVFLLAVLGRYRAEAEDRSKGLHGLTIDAYETIVTLGYLTLAILLLLQFVTPFSDESEGYIIIHSFVVVMLGLYSISKTYVNEGMTLLLPALIMLMSASCRFAFDESLPLVIYLFMSLMMLPSIIVFHINKDRMSVLSNTLVMLIFVLWSLTESDLVFFVMLAAAVVIVYNAIGNWCIVELRRKVLPLLR